MPYLIFSTRQGEEIGRRRLEGPLAIGRSSECDVSLDDGHLSRRHCRIMPSAAGFVLSDLGSRNGTCFRGHRISSRVLRDGDVFQVGRFNVIYRAGEMRTGEENEPGLSRPRRPATPFAAAHATAAAITFKPPPASTRPADAFPTPIPITADAPDWLELGDELLFGNPDPDAHRDPDPDADTAGPIDPDSRHY